jgi:ligand-binding sensor domain-containing protein/signal transduction histidine kinase/DNA-binding response OmpR family regulator
MNGFSMPLLNELLRVRKAFRVLIMLCLPLAGWSQNLTFNHLTVEQGLSSNSVLAITQDAAGFLWLGTRQGINRYDGSRFKNYLLDEKGKYPININNILTLLCDSRKRVWAGSSAGLLLYNEALDSFIRIPIQGNPNRTVNCLYEDRAGTLWIGTLNGLFALPKSSDSSFTVHTARDGDQGIADNNVRTVFEDHHGYLWVGTGNGLTRMYAVNGQYQYTNFYHDSLNSHSLSANYITAIAEDQRQTLWIGTQNNGLNVYVPAAQSFVRYTDHPSNKQGLINNHVRIIKRARNGRLWIGTQEGLSVIDTATTNMVSYQNDAGNKKSLSQNSIYSLFEDASGSMWVGTYFGGVNYTYSYTTSFKVMQNEQSRLSISNNVVSSIVEDGQQNLWIGTEGGGLNHFNRQTGLFRVYKNELLDPSSLGSNLVKVVYIDKEQNVWCGTHGGGLNVLPRGADRFTRYLYKEHDATTAHSEITSLAEDNEGRLWMISNSQLRLFAKKGTVLAPLPLDVIKGKLADVQGNTLLKDGQGNIWIGAASRLYVVKDNELKELNRGSYVNSLLEDKAGNIWAALSSGGLLMYHTRQQQLIRYTEKEGLPNRNILGLLEDEGSNLWLSTNNGLMKYNPRTQTCQSYTVSDGLAGNEFNYNSYLRDSQGAMYFGGYNGISYFYPGQIVTNSYVAPVVFTGLRLFNNPVTIGGADGLLQENINHTQQLVLKHHQNVITIEFALLNFIKSNKNKYAYQLEGFDQNWNEVSSGSATYTNLPRGKYKLHIKGANNDGVWSKVATLSIRVLPPFWLTWWAYTIYVLLFCAILFVVIRFFFLRVLLKKEDELHQVKLNFFTNVSHEIRTHLTLVMAPVEKILDGKGQDVLLQQQLSQVKNNVHRLLRLVGELMDFRKAETNHLSLQVARHSFIPFLQEIYSNFEDMSLSKNIHISFVHPESELPLYFDRAQLEKVFFNLLANAFKFTPDGGRIALEVSVQGDQVVVTVTDNGRGIAPEYLGKLFTNFFQVADHGRQNTGYGIGLALSKHIVELHQGHIRVASEPATDDKTGKTVFTVTLLQGKSHFMIHGIPVMETLAGEQAGSDATTAFAPTPTLRAAEADGSEDKLYTILVVEDNAELRLLVQETLGSRYHVLCAENGLQGWDMATEHIPDVIVSDVMMPEMDGFTFCSQLKTDERTSHIPVILLTAKSAQTDQVSGLETGADVYLTKPFSPKVLALNVRNLLTSREKMRQRFGRQLQEANGLPATANVPDEAASNLVITIDSAFLQKVVQLVEEHLDDPDFGVEKLSRKVAMSAPVLYKKIKAVTDMSVNEFVKSIRLKRAAQLLQQGELTVYEVAYSVGYQDRKYFSKEFKKQFGKTPSEYASNNKEGLS